MNIRDKELESFDPSTAANGNGANYGEEIAVAKTKFLTGQMALRFKVGTGFTSSAATARFVVLSGPTAGPTTVIADAGTFAHSELGAGTIKELPLPAIEFDEHTRLGIINSAAAAAGNMDFVELFAFLN